MKVLVTNKYKVSTKTLRLLCKTELLSLRSQGSLRKFLEYMKSNCVGTVLLNSYI